MAEGAAPLPTQLQLGEISQELRAYLWEAIHRSLSESLVREVITTRVGDPWLSICYAKHITRDHGMADDFDNTDYAIIGNLRHTYEHGSFASVFGLTQFILRHDACPDDLADDILLVLEAARAAYTLVDGDTFMPIATKEEGRAVEAALEATTAKGFEGPRAHLKLAAEELTAGNWAASIRESIHSVEATAKIIEPKANTLGPALKALEKKHAIHKAMQTGFESLYGFTSDEKGIRHSLLEKGEAKVDQADAQYMLGACAAFVSYLLARTRE